MNRSSWKDALRYSFPKTVPVMNEEVPRDLVPEQVALDFDCGSHGSRS